jgi:membrane-associated phospholipid phosphatase
VDVRWKRAAIAVCVIVALVLPGADARADDAARGRASPYRLKWTYDSALTALGAATAMTAFIGHPKPACFPGCEPPPGMLGIDDASIGNYSPPAHSLANVVVGSLVIAPLILNAADSRFDGWAEDTFVTLQSILLSQAVTQVMKSAVGRTAPLVYNPNAAQSDLDSPDTFRSFISGHSSTSFAAATAYTVTFWKRHPDSPWRFVVLGVSHALATSVALLKIKAGYHYATDVAAGALVGSAMGLLVPVLHSEW